MFRVRRLKYHEQFLAELLHPEIRCRGFYFCDCGFEPNITLFANRDAQWSRINRKHAVWDKGSKKQLDRHLTTSITCAGFNRLAEECSWTPALCRSLLTRLSLKQGCGAGAQAILDDWSQTQKLLNGGAWNFISGSTALICALWRSRLLKLFCICLTVRYIISQHLISAGVIIQL